MGIELSIPCAQRKTREKLLSTRFEKEKSVPSDESGIYDTKWLEDLENAFLKHERSTTLSEKPKNTEVYNNNSSNNASNLDSFVNEQISAKLNSYKHFKLISTLRTISSEIEGFPTAIAPNPCENSESLVLFQEFKSAKNIKQLSATVKNFRELVLKLENESVHKIYSNLSQALKSIQETETLIGHYNNYESDPQLSLILYKSVPEAGLQSQRHYEIEAIDQIDDHANLENVLNERAKDNFLLRTMVDILQKGSSKEVSPLHVLIFEKLRENNTKFQYMVTAHEFADLNQNANPLVEIPRKIDILSESDDLFFSSMITDRKNERLILIFAKEKA